MEKGFTMKLGLLLAASSAVRSNGLLNLGFPLYRSLKIVAKEIAVHRRLKQGGNSIDLTCSGVFFLKFL